MFFHSSSPLTSNDAHFILIPRRQRKTAQSFNVQQARRLSSLHRRLADLVNIRSARKPSWHDRLRMGLLPHLFGQMPHAQTTSNVSDFGGHLLALVLIRILTGDTGNRHESQAYVISVTPRRRVFKNGGTMMTGIATR